MYPEQLVAPMRNDLTTAGFKELKTVADVDQELRRRGQLGAETFIDLFEHRDDFDQEENRDTDGDDDDAGRVHQR